MCLIVHHKLGTVFPQDEIVDWYSRNQDGYGVMYAENGTLKFVKGIGVLDDWLKFYDKHKHRECVFHLRMQTHGDVDLVNCHPYPVFGFEGEGSTDFPMLLMHNGILNTGNKADSSKSDTWHYIRDYLRPMLRNNAEFTFTNAFHNVVGSHITSANRFVFMDALGRVQIVNKSTGVEHRDCWFSNTYAWSAHKFMGKRSWSNCDVDDKTLFDRWLKSKANTHPYIDTSTAVMSTVGDPPLPLSKNAWKRMNRKAERLTGKGIPPIGQATTPEKDSGSWYVNGKLVGKNTAVSPSQLLLIPPPGLDRVGQEFVDDVLELRSQLEVAYPDACTKDSQIEMLVKEVGPTRAFFAMELLLEGKIKASMWDMMTGSPAAARLFARADATMLKNLPVGKYNNRVSGRTEVMT